MTLEEKQLEIARAVAAVISLGDAERTTDGWKILRENIEGGIVSAPTEVAASSFSGALKRAAACGMATADLLEEKYVGLLRAWNVERF